MDRQTIQRATLVIMALFALQPLAIGGWLALIPLVKENLELSKGELAFALLGMPVALVPTLQFAGRIVGSFGPRRTFVAVFPIQSVAILLPLVAWNGVSLFFALAIAGAAVAFLEVAINVYAGQLEKRSGVLIMNRCHGFWALGITFGSAWISLAPFDSPWMKLGLLAGFSMIAGIWSATALPRLGDGNETGVAPGKRRLAELPKALLFIALFMFSVTMTEGAMADWAAVYLAERLGDEVSQAGIAVTIFSAFLAIGRFLGDWLKRHLGSESLARATLSCSLVGLAMLILPLPLWFAYVGFAFVGFGVSVGFPLGVSAVASLDDKHEAPNIAIMSTVALGGFLAGPPIIGTIAEMTTLPLGLAALLPGLILSFWLSKWLKPRDSL